MFNGLSGGFGSVCDDAVEPRHTRDERGKRRRRANDEIRDGVAAPMGFQIPFAQVEQVAARLDFRRAPQISRIHAQAGKRIGAGHDDVRGEDRAEFEGKGVSERSNFSSAPGARVASSPTRARR